MGPVVLVVEFGVESVALPGPPWQVEVAGRRSGTPVEAAGCSEMVRVVRGLAR
jgi:hypothetical protein